MSVNTYTYFDRALVLIERCNDQFLDLGALLHKGLETEPDEFKTQISLPQLGKRKGYYLVETHQAFADYDPELPRLAAIGWTKLQIVAKYVSADNREDLLALAENNTAANLKAIMRGEKPIIGGHSILLHFTKEEFIAFADAILVNGATANGAGFIGKETVLIKALGKAKS